jgi:thiamine-phosphate pyrophosphorylase
LARRKLASVAAHLNARSPHAGRVPMLVLMTDDERLPDPLAAARLLPKGAMIIVRSRDSAKRVQLAYAMMALARSRGLLVLIANDAVLASRCGADGLHLSEANAHRAAHWSALRPQWFIAAAVHSLRAAVLRRYVDAIFLSPVFATASHPGRTALTAVRANAMVHRLAVPAYALGGVTAHNAPLLHGFAGIAAIGALAP